MLSLQTIKAGKEDKELFKDQVETAEASSKVAEADESEFMMITVGHCYNLVPGPKYDAKVGMTSRATMSQKQYEESVMKSVMADKK